MTQYCEITIQDAIFKLQNAAKQKITFGDIAKLLGISRQAISNRVARNIKLQEFEWNKLQEHFLQTFSDNSVNTIEEYKSNSMLEIDYYPDIFGIFKNGKFILSNDKIKLNIPLELICSYSPKKTYSIINASGNSMSPLIVNNDKLIIEHYSNSQITDNQVYIFGYDEKLFIKRLVQNINQLSVISDNEDKTVYPTQYIEGINMKNIFIIGKVTGLLRKFS